ncbi:MAG TPA: hypothetical protein PKU80_03935 [Candidatus Limiplasma sp.]|nr:hypothetical protein [Candidatus Limiplasma sp.]HRX09428.1 hypothetical protein [Candidatus Limiplasma sp.]
MKALREAAIGIGSNSLRLLVADIEQGNQTAVLRKRIGLRVFTSLNDTHEMDESMIHDACEAVQQMKQYAQQSGAELIRLFATSAVRDAKNSAALQDALWQNTGLHLSILSGEQEAKYSFLGAAGNASTGMIDIGGGSTEIVIGDHGQPQYAISLQAGAVRMFQEMPITSAVDTKAVMDSVARLLSPNTKTIWQMKTPTQWVGVGGTMTAAATCIQGIDWHSHKRVHGFGVQRQALRHAMETLADMPLTDRKKLGTVPPDRADIVVHGFAILLQCMETLCIDTITISEHTNLDGFLRAITAGGSESAE